MALTLHHKIELYVEVYIIETSQWSTIPIPIDNKSCHLLFYNVIENKAHFVLECPLYNSIIEKFLSLFENVDARVSQIFLPIGP